MKILEWTISIMAIIGATALSFGRLEVFFLFTVCNVLSIYFFWKKEMNGMLVLNAFYLLTSINGIYTYLYRQ